MVIEAMKLKDEKDLIYSDENETRELGCIGHLRGDFGRSGNDFYHKWFPHKCFDLKDDKLPERGVCCYPEEQERKEIQK